MCLDGVTRRLSTASRLAAAAAGGPTPQVHLEARDLPALDGDDGLVVLAELVGVEGAAQRDFQLGESQRPAGGDGIVHGGAVPAEGARAGEGAVGVTQEILGPRLGSRAA